MSFQEKNHFFNPFQYAAFILSSGAILVGISWSWSYNCLPIGVWGHGIWSLTQLLSIFRLASLQLNVADSSNSTQKMWLIRESWEITEGPKGMENRVQIISSEKSHRCCFAFLYGFNLPYTEEQIMVSSIVIDHFFFINTIKKWWHLKHD